MIPAKRQVSQFLIWLFENTVFIEYIEESICPLIYRFSWLDDQPRIIDIIVGHRFVPLFTLGFPIYGCLEIGAKNMIDMAMVYVALSQQNAYNVGIRYFVRN